jgi:large subunit ribosomal protein L2
LGRNSNIKNKRQFLTSAGTNVKKGFKSKVRGVAMNPVDHPHGGRTKTNNPEKSP